MSYIVVAGHQDVLMVSLISILGDRCSELVHSAHLDLEATGGVMNRTFSRTFQARKPNFQIPGLSRVFKDPCEP